MSLARMAVPLAAAALVLPVSLALPAPAHAAAPRIDYSLCYNMTEDGTQCLDFPDFGLNDMPELVAGEQVTFTGGGASLAGLSADDIELLGGFEPFRGEGYVPPGPFKATVREDGTWTITMTVPDQETVDGLAHVGLEIWFNIYATTPGPIRLRSITYPVTILPASARTGWYREGSVWYWGDGAGARAKGWKEIGGSWYFFDRETAVMATGWVSDGGSWYYLGSSGAMVTGWVRHGASWYYLRPSGAMATGWVSDGGSWYYLGSSGAMVTGWVRDGASWYYLGSSGTMATGWVKIDGHWSLFASGGAWQHYG